MDDTDTEVTPTPAEAAPTSSTNASNDEISELIVNGIEGGLALVRALTALSKTVKESAPSAVAYFEKSFGNANSVEEAPEKAEEPEPEEEEEEEEESGLATESVEKDAVEEKAMAKVEEAKADASATTPPEVAATPWGSLLAADTGATTEEEGNADGVRDDDGGHETALAPSHETPIETGSPSSVPEVSTGGEAPEKGDPAAAAEVAVTAETESFVTRTADEAGESAEPLKEVVIPVTIPQPSGETSSADGEPSEAASEESGEPAEETAPPAATTSLPPLTSLASLAGEGPKRENSDGDAEAKPENPVTPPVAETEKPFFNPSGGTFGLFDADDSNDDAPEAPSATKSPFILFDEEDENEEAEGAAASEGEPPEPATDPEKQLWLEKQKQTPAETSTAPSEPAADSAADPLPDSNPAPPPIAPQGTPFNIDAVVPPFSPEAMAVPDPATVPDADPGPESDAESGTSAPPLAGNPAEPAPETEGKEGDEEPLPFTPSPVGSPFPSIADAPDEEAQGSIPPNPFETLNSPVGESPFEPLSPTHATAPPAEAGESETSSPVAESASADVSLPGATPFPAAASPFQVNPESSPQPETANPFPQVQPSSASAPPPAFRTQAAEPADTPDSAEGKPPTGEPALKPAPSTESPPAPADAPPAPFDPIKIFTEEDAIPERGAAEVPEPVAPAPFRITAPTPAPENGGNAAPDLAASPFVPTESEDGGSEQQGKTQLPPPRDKAASPAPLSDGAESAPTPAASPFLAFEKAAPQPNGPGPAQGAPEPAAAPSPSAPANPFQGTQSAQGGIPIPFPDEKKPIVKKRFPLIPILITLVALLAAGAAGFFVVQSKKKQQREESTPTDGTGKISGRPVSVPSPPESKGGSLSPPSSPDVGTPSTPPSPTISKTNSPAPMPPVTPRPEIPAPPPETAAPAAPEAVPNPDKMIPEAPSPDSPILEGTPDNAVRDTPPDPSAVEPPLQLPEVAIGPGGTSAPPVLDPVPMPTPPGTTPGGFNMPKTPAELDAVRKDPTQSLLAFLNAPDLESRKHFIHHPDQLAPRMGRYYAQVNPGPIRYTGVDVKVSGKVPGTNLQTYLFHVATPKQTDGFPVSVEETSEGFRIDWEAFIQFNDGSLESFIADANADAGPFYVILRRSHYFGDAVPGQENMISYRVISPLSSEKETFAFIDRRTATGEQVERKFTWGKTYRPVLQLEWVAEGGKPWIALRDIVRDTWRGGQ